MHMHITIATKLLTFVGHPPNAIEPQLLRWVNGMYYSISGENSSLTQYSLACVGR